MAKTGKVKMSFVLCVLIEKSSTLHVLLQCLKFINRTIWCLTS